jgi:hypothetical protein
VSIDSQIVDVERKPQNLYKIPKKAEVVLLSKEKEKGAKRTCGWEWR